MSKVCVVRYRSRERWLGWTPNNLKLWGSKTYHLGQYLIFFHLACYFIVFNYFFNNSSQFFSSVTLPIWQEDESVHMIHAITYAFVSDYDNHLPQTSVKPTSSSLAVKFKPSTTPPWIGSFNQSRPSDHYRRSSNICLTKVATLPSRPNSLCFSCALSFSTLSSLLLQTVAC